MNLSESPGPVQPRSVTSSKRTRQHWPILVQNGSVTAKIYLIRRPAKKGKAAFEVYNVSYHLPTGRKVDQRGTLAKAREHARLMVDSIAAGEVDAAEMSKHDRLELLALRERAAKFGMQPMMAMDEWLKARDMVGGEILTACEKWKGRLTQFERISAHECVKRYKESFVKLRRARAPKHATPEEVQALLIPKSYRVVLNAFVAKFGDQYMDALQKAQLEGWFVEKASASGWTGNTYRKRVVTLFRWARDDGYLPRDQVTEADMTARSEEEAPQRELTTPGTLARILFLLQEGIDLHNVTAKYDPRPDLVPPVALSAFSGYRSIEGHTQTWEDLDLDEEQGAVTKAKRGTKADRATQLPECALAWLKLTAPEERTGPLHAYETEVHTIIRNHLRRTIGLQLPSNTLRKSWESYRYVLSNDEGATAAKEAGHTNSVATKHYRNPRAKKSAAELWFEVYPDPFIRNAYIIQNGISSGQLPPNPIKVANA